MAAIASKYEEKDTNKRKERSSINYDPEEPYLLVKECFNIQDDAHEHIDTDLRQQLRPINDCPKTYWKKGAFKQVERPLCISNT